MSYEHLSACHTGHTFKKVLFRDLRGETQTFRVDVRRIVSDPNGRLTETRRKVLLRKWPLARDIGRGKRFAAITSSMICGCMGARLKILSVVGTRPNFMKVAPIRRALQEGASHDLCPVGEVLVDRTSLREMYEPTLDSQTDVSDWSPCWSAGGVAGSPLSLKQSTENGPAPGLNHQRE